MSSISAGTTSTTTLVHSGDTTGSLVFKTNDTGSGGTTAVTIDTAQNVGIGTTSPSAKLHVSGGQSYVTGASGAGAYSRWYNNAQTTGDFQVGQGWASASDNVAVLNNNANAAMIFGTNGSERMRIDSSGNLNLNTTSAFGKFCADIGAYVFTSGQSGSSLTWGTSSTSGRPAITVASNGTWQDAAFRTVVSPDNGSTWLGWSNGINIETGSNTLSWCINTSANSSRVFSSGSVAMRLTTGGALSTTTGSLGTISDIRMKKDVVDATPKLDQLLQLRVVNYVLIDDPEEKKLLGFVAQEVEQVFAGLIEEHDILDPDTKEVTMRQKTVKTTVLIPMLVKAIQELKAINDQQAETINAQSAALAALTARVVALEGK